MAGVSRSLQKMNIGPKFVELAADMFISYLYSLYFIVAQDDCRPISPGTKIQRLNSKKARPQYHVTCKDEYRSSN